MVKQRLALPRRILRNLVPQMIHLRTRRSWWVALRRLNPANLHLQEELGHLDCKIASRAPNARLSRQIYVQAVLELLQIGASKGRGSCKFVQGEGERREVGLAEVDGREGSCARGDVWDGGEGLCGCGAGDGVGEGVGDIGDFSWEGLGADDEAGRLARVERGRQSSREGEERCEGNGFGVHLGC